MSGVRQRISVYVAETAPLFPPACGLIAGVLLDQWWRFSPFIYAGLLIVTTVLLVFRRIRHAAGLLLIVVASICAGAVLHAGNVREVPPSGVERYAEARRRLARLRGTVVSEPRILETPPNPFGLWISGRDKTALLLSAESIAGPRGDVPVTGKVRVTVGEAVLNLRDGERVEVFGWLYRMEPVRNPGSFDWAAFYRQQGIAAAMYCENKENVRRLDPAPPPGPGLRGWLTRTTRAFLTDDLATGAEEETSLLEAMILGHRSRLDRRLDEIFIRSGCMHYLAVSGTHVVMLLSFVWLVGRVLLGTKRRSAWLMAIVVCVYALIAEPRPPILRATIMALIFCASLILRRPSAHLNWMSASALLLVAWDPLTVCDVGFQLSFAAVLGVSYLSGPLLRFTTALRGFTERVVRGRASADLVARLTAGEPPDPPKSPWRTLRAIWNWLALGLVVSAAAWLAGLPIVAVHFNRVQPWGALTSLVVWPLIYVEMVLGLAKVVFSAVMPVLGALIGKALTASNTLLIRVVEVLASLPGASMTVSAPPWWLIVLCYLLLLLFALRFRRLTVDPRPGRPGGRDLSTGGSPGLSIACAGACALLILGGAVWTWGGRHADRLILTVLSVGGGSASVIELPNGEVILYDAGSKSPYDVGRSVVVPFLRHRGISRIAEVYVSHPDLDHFSGLPSVLEDVHVGPVILNEYFGSRSPPRSASRHLLDFLAQRRHRLGALEPQGARWSRDGVTFEVLWPPTGLAEGLPDNDTSTVLRISYAGRSVLLPGDIMEHAESELLRRGGLEADVLVLPHHGSIRDSTSAFVKAVQPQVLIRSSEQNVEETSPALLELAGNAPLYNTADVGAVQVVIDARGLRIAATRRGSTTSHNIGR